MVVATRHLQGMDINEQTSTPVTMVAEFISDMLDRAGKDADIIIEHDVIVTVCGENMSGLAIYGKGTKSFRFFYATNIDVVLACDDDEIYNETDSLKTFCDQVCR